MDFRTLETECPECEGTGKRPSDRFLDMIFNFGEKSCDNCDGKGYNLTPEGKELVKFILRHVTTGSIDGGGLRYK